MTTSDETIETNLSAPRKASGDGESAEQHSLPDQIAAAEWLDERQARNSRKLPIRTAKIRPDGC